MPKPPDRALLVRVINKARSQGYEVDEIAMSPAKFVELLANLPQGLPFPPNGPPDTFFGTKVVARDTLNDETLSISHRPALVRNPDVT